MRILGYVGNDTVITQRDAQILTHINIAFGKLRLNGDIDVDHLDIFGKMEEIRSYNQDIKIVLSLVPEEPEAFTVCAKDSDLRKKAAKSCALMVTQYGFDGVDFDWEYPCVPSNGVDATKDDKNNFTLFCQCVREEMDAITLKDGTKPLVTIAAGADLYYTTCVDLPKVIQYLDYICLMTYDLKCGFHALAGHHTQLFSSTGDVFQNSCDQALRLFHSAGVPKDKLLMGAAFYSRKWENIQDRNHGFLQISKTGGGYGPNFAELQANYINKNGYVRYWDDEAKAPFLFDGSTFLSYDDEESIQAKCEYVKDQAYGGIFYWVHKCDPTGTLIGVIGKALDR